VSPHTKECHVVLDDKYANLLGIPNGIVNCASWETACLIIIADLNTDQVQSFFCIVV
jgi:uncharacterized membrane protein